MVVVVVVRGVKIKKINQAESQAFSMLVREGLQPLLRVMRYRGGEGEIRETVSHDHFIIRGGGMKDSD